ncbi:Bls1p NDAI_0J02400 [Naumovozyma dairenensis CBS 421]|uniref:Uncharacterized protein n=1 Tax=Naumovozyma dairenensis (strain ATCC 10597 / BCRC 20456 / CBS 421 / NBRC 0211 / NRRL Y-12639) TaxID=1071378 RepID=G0WH54_NAUDC|nr:hypothetical protein NDAI_0J02400 [Naumovozyma dairenensis CBS 421]CCD27132.1 hypothetical protein NDAI_0J02400 [Naumovozyma dairenensis CBS 421]
MTSTTKTYGELEELFKRIINSETPTEVSKTLKEIENNNKYINDVQFKKLIELHDDRFKNKCLKPMQGLCTKYNNVVVQDGDLQIDAALVDRDLRVLETTLQLIKERKG